MCKPIIRTSVAIPYQLMHDADPLNAVLMHYSLNELSRKNENKQYL